MDFNQNTWGLNLPSDNCYFEHGHNRNVMLTIASCSTTSCHIAARYIYCEPSYFSMIGSDDCMMATSIATGVTIDCKAVTNQCISFKIP